MIIIIYPTIYTDMLATIKLNAFNAYYADIRNQLTPLNLYTAMIFSYGQQSSLLCIASQLV